MHKVILIVSIFFANILIAQPITDLYKTAKNLMLEGDYENATLVYTKLLTNEPNNITYLKDFAYLSFLKRDFAKSIEISKKLVNDTLADEQTFQLLGMNYKSIAMYSEANLLYKTALEKYANSGILYSEFADLNLIEKKEKDAIKNWEKGIEVDPNYPNNYFNASKYYAKKNQLIWSIIYGEVFLNLESYTIRTAEIKELVFDAYKKLLYSNALSNQSSNNQFENIVKSTFVNSVEKITAINLTALRTKFILTWFHNKNNEKYPFRIFDQLRYLIREGMFDAYNQWLFGIVIDPLQYKEWAELHTTETQKFKQFQEGRVFKLIPGQYYR